jgi:hypothetical protein
MNDDHLKKVEQDVLNEQQLSDGIQQIVPGALLTILSLSWFLNALEIGIVFPVLFLISPLIVKQLRKRITYPRIGYAKIKDLSTDLIIIMIIAGLPIFFLVSSYTFDLKIIPRSLLTDSLMLTYLAVICAALMLIFFLKRKNILFLLYGVFMMLFVSAVWMLRLSVKMDNMFVFILGFALITLIYGIFTLRAFLRKYPVLKEEDIKSNHDII